MLSNSNNDQQAFVWSWLHPRYWPSWIGVALLTLIAYLPERCYKGLSIVSAFLCKPFLKKRWRIAYQNLNACFPKNSSEKNQQLAEESIHSTIQGYFESIRSWLRPLEPYKPRVRIEGLEHVEAALKTGKGLIIAGGHFSILDLAGALFSLYYPLNITYRPLNNPVLNYFMMKGRKRWAKSCFEPKQFRSYIKCLKQGEILWYAPDQDFGREHSVFAPFFGIQTATVKGLSTMARSSGSKVLTASFFRLANGYYHIRLRAPLNIPSDSFKTDAAVFNKRLEQEIRKYPSQYYWIHRRFKTRPNQGQSFYN